MQHLNTHKQQLRALGLQEIISHTRTCAQTTSDAWFSVCVMQVLEKDEDKQMRTLLTKMGVQCLQADDSIRALRELYKQADPLTPNAHMRHLAYIAAITAGSAESSELLHDTKAIAPSEELLHDFPLLARTAQPSDASQYKAASALRFPDASVRAIEPELLAAGFPLVAVEVSMRNHVYLE
jgi:hypothetical protein